MTHTDFPFHSISASNQAPHPEDFPHHLSSFPFFSILIIITWTISSLDHDRCFLMDHPDCSPVLPHQNHPQYGYHSLLPKINLILIFAWTLSYFTKQIPSYLTVHNIFQGHTSSRCTTSPLGLPYFYASATLNFPELSGCSTIFIPEHLCLCSYLYQEYSSLFSPLLTTTSFGFKFRITSF